MIKNNAYNQLIQLSDKSLISQMHQFKFIVIISILFICYAIPMFVLPKFIGYTPISMWGVLLGYHSNGSSIASTNTIFDDQTLMNKMCNIWNREPDISYMHIRIGPGCGVNAEYQTQVDRIYIYLCFETLMFFILAGLFIHNIHKEHWSIRSILYLCLLLWAIGIVFDITATTNYDTMNNFVYQQLYDIDGYIYRGTVVSDHDKFPWAQEKFTSQSSFMDMTCHALKYPNNGTYWIFLSDTTPYSPNHSLGNYKITSLAFKSSSLFLLIIVNIIGLLIYKFTKLSDNCDTSESGSPINTDSANSTSSPKSSPSYSAGSSTIISTVNLSSTDIN